MSLDPSIVAALVNIIQTGTSPEVLAMQQQLLQRLLLAGDVAPSRIPPPRNISEVGGYINLLAGLGETDVETELIASALGVAPPANLLTLTPGHPLAMVNLPNDRPVGSKQPTIPLTFSVRSDFRDAIKAALAAIHAQGGTLPFLSPVPALPIPSPTFTAPKDWLPTIGRELSVLPTIALTDPSSDPVALASKTAGGPYELVSLGSGAGAPASAPWFALKWVSGSLTEVSLPTAQFMVLAPILATAGFYPSSPLPSPTSPSDSKWAVLTNITGLVPEATTLKSELLLLYSLNQLGASALAPYLQLVWDGTTFS
jgi:hypothetical protein